jgi:alpha-D-ribose 1-methylphosphonate 5-triphosphate synthase subunit PhnL
MPEDNKGTIIELTEEQKEQMRQATGQDHLEIRVETVGFAQLAPRLAAKVVAKRLSSKKAAKRLSSKKAAKRLSSKKAAKRLSSKKAAKRLSSKKATKR